MGIRTPWTLSSEVVWKKTHALGQKIFILAGIGFMIIPYLPVKYFAWYIIVAVLLMVLGTFGYSYIIYRNLKETK